MGHPKETIPILGTRADWSPESGGKGCFMAGRVYSYSRFSDPRQAAGHSLERQRAYAARWAAENGLALDESLTLHDAGLSAYHQQHIKSGALGAFLAAGVEAQDTDARMRARQLVADTFERIVVYHHGTQPDDAPPGTIDVILVAKGGAARLLRINRAGDVIAAEQAE